MNMTLQALWQETRDGDSVRRRLYQVLRQSIIRMVLAPGQALSEKEVAREAAECGLASRTLAEPPELMRRFPDMFETQQTQSLVEEASQ